MHYLNAKLALSMELLVILAMIDMNGTEHNVLKFLALLQIVALVKPILMYVKLAETTRS